jgi:hypothetical protein
LMESRSSWLRVLNSARISMSITRKETAPANVASSGMGITKLRGVANDCGRSSGEIDFPNREKPRVHSDASSYQPRPNAERGPAQPAVRLSPRRRPERESEPHPNPRTRRTRRKKGEVACTEGIHPTVDGYYQRQTECHHECGQYHQRAQEKGNAVKAMPPQLSPT